MFCYVWWNCKALSVQHAIAVRNQFLQPLLLPLAVEFIALELNCLKHTCFWHINEMWAAVAFEWFITAVIAKIHLWALRACPFVLLLNCAGRAVCCETWRELTPQRSNSMPCKVTVELEADPRFPVSSMQLLIFSACCPPPSTFVTHLMSFWFYLGFLHYSRIIWLLYSVSEKKTQVNSFWRFLLQYIYYSVCLLSKI